MLHWGVRAGKKEWVLPPNNLRPSGTEQAGNIAVETPFVQGSEELEVNSSGPLQLQTLQLSIPAAADVTGLTFVLRSGDSSAWFRDGKYSNLKSLLPECFMLIQDD